MACDCSPCRRRKAAECAELERADARRRRAAKVAKVAKVAHDAAAVARAAAELEADAASRDVAKVARSDRAELARLIKRIEPKIRAKVAAMLAWLQDRKSTAEIEVAVTRRLAQDILSEEDVARAAAAIAAEVGAAYVVTARAVRELVSAAVKLPGALDAASDRAVDALDAMASRLTRDLIVEQRQLVQEVLREGLREGLNPRQTARLFKDAISLAPNQVRYVATYRRALMEGSFGDALGRRLRDRRFDKLINRAAHGKGALTRAEIDKMVRAYAARALKLRAETIARTETLRAVHLGSIEGWAQAIADGDIDPAQVERTWIQTFDRRTRDSHRAMRGQTRPFGIPFTTGDGYSIMFPHDPAAPLSETVNCRCAVVTRLVPPKAQTAAAPLANPGTTRAAAPRDAARPRRVNATHLHPRG